MMRLNIKVQKPVIKSATNSGKRFFVSSKAVLRMRRCRPGGNAKKRISKWWKRHRYLRFWRQLQTNCSMVARCYDNSDCKTQRSGGTPDVTITRGRGKLFS